MPDLAHGWTGPDLEALQDALLDAFPSRDDLQRFVKFGLDINLNEVADGDNLTTVTFGLIEWANVNGQLELLVAEAVRKVPGNPKLRALADSRGIDASAPRPAATGPAAPPRVVRRPATPASAGSDNIRLLVIGTFCVTALFAVCIVFVMVLVGVLPAAQLWVAVVPVGLLAAVAFRMAPRHGPLASA